MKTGTQSRPIFGRPDPFCLFAVVPAFLVAVLMLVLDLWVLASAGFAFAALILLFDSWVNRPEPAPEPKRRVRRRETFQRPTRHNVVRSMRTASVHRYR